jgi:hypothetical protein
MARLAWTALAATGLILFLSSSPARAEPSAAELASARDMFSEARRAEDAGRWAEALQKVKAVATVKMTPQVRFHLGLCEEHTGQLVEALNSFEVARSEAVEQGVTSVVDEAREHAQNVRARMPKLLIALPSGVDAKVEVDGQTISASLLARPLPFDPGRHTVAASAPGLAYKGDITIAEKDEKRIDVTFTPVPIAPAPKPPSTPSPAPAAAAPSAPQTSPASDAGTSSSGGSSALGWVAVGTGGAAIAGSVITAAARQSSINQIDNLCKSHMDCPPADRPTLEDAQGKARTFGALAVALGAGGGALVVTGIVLVLTSGSSPAPATGRVAMTPWVGPGGGGVLGAVAW